MTSVMLKTAEPMTPLMPMSSLKNPDHFGYLLLKLIIQKDLFVKILFQGSPKPQQILGNLPQGSFRLVAIYCENAVGQLENFQFLAATAYCRSQHICSIGSLSSAFLMD